MSRVILRGRPVRRGSAVVEGSRWRTGGWDAVEKQSTRPKTNSKASPEETVARVIALRQQLTDAGLDAGPHSIAAHLQRSGHNSPSVTTIWRILTRAELITPEPRKRLRRSYPRFEADLRNECWQSDFTHWPLALTLPMRSVQRQ